MKMLVIEVERLEQPSVPEILERKFEDMTNVKNAPISNYMVGMMFSMNTKK